MNILLFGGTGNLGKCIVSELKNKDFNFKVVIRPTANREDLNLNPNQIIVADITNPNELAPIFTDFDIVISALGKSVSLNDHSKGGFMDIDYNIHKQLIEQAQQSSIKKFIYVSAFHSELYPDLAYFKSHHLVHGLLEKSEMDYCVIKPPALFSAFLELIDMAKKGQLINIGKGDKRTNPICEKDLAEVCVNAIFSHELIIEAGGKQVYSRKQIMEIVQNKVAPNKKIRSMPYWVFGMMLPMLKVLNRNTYDKFAFFLRVMQKDTIAPKIGETRFEDYIESKLSKTI